MNIRPNFGQILLMMGLLLMTNSLYAQEGIVTPTIKAFTVYAEVIDLDTLQNNQVLIHVSWEVENRPVNTNVVFEQVMDDGLLRNAELPRDEALIDSVGDGLVSLLIPGDNPSEVAIQVRLVNLENGDTLAMRVVRLPLVTEESSLTEPAIIEGAQAPETECHAAGGLRTHQVNAYLQPDETAIVGAVEIRDTLVTARSDNGFYRLAGGNGADGWVQGKEIILIGPCTELPIIFAETEVETQEQLTTNTPRIALNGCRVTSRRESTNYYRVPDPSALLDEISLVDALAIARSDNGYFQLYIEYNGTLHYGWVAANGVSTNEACASLPVTMTQQEVQALAPANQLPAPPMPSIESFTIAPQSVTSTDTITISWAARNVDLVRITAFKNNYGMPEDTPPPAVILLGEYTSSSGSVTVPVQKYYSISGDYWICADFISNRTGWETQGSCVGSFVQ